jgi:hypothetical protein
MSEDSSMTASEQAKYQADMKVTLNPHEKTLNPNEQILNLKETDRDQAERDEYSRKLAKVDTHTHSKFNFGSSISNPRS